jgi:hypothetical protein
MSLPAQRQCDMKLYSRLLGSPAQRSVHAGAQKTIFYQYQLSVKGLAMGAGGSMVYGVLHEDDF